MEYPKIHSLWKRHGWYLDEGKKNNPEYQKGRQSFIIGDYALPEFGLINKWQCQEKIDGTNIRIHFTKECSAANDDAGQPLKTYMNVKFFGRTNEATLSKPLQKYLFETFTIEKMSQQFSKNETFQEVWLFGEGYGPKIQAGGGNYRKDAGFILFDVHIGNWWLEQSAVKEIAEALGVPYAPIIRTMTESEIVEYIKSKPYSLCSITPHTMEGIIARTEPLLIKRNGDPLMFKLKCKEF